MGIFLLKNIPKEYIFPRYEPNLLKYHQFKILAAAFRSNFAGSIRIGVRVDRPKDGLITDLYVDAKFKGLGLENHLVKAAEKVLKDAGVKKIDTVYLDGPGILPHFYALGFMPFRRSVQIEWDLEKLKLASLKSQGYEIQYFPKPPVGQIIELMLDSFQPYWTIWIEEKTLKDRREMLTRLLTQEKNGFFIARKNGKTCGLVDTNLFWGVMIRKSHIGQLLGSALLNHSFDYLKGQGVKRVSTLSTSGLDDYDPQIYLYTLKGGGKITREYIVLQKLI